MANPPASPEWRAAVEVRLDRELSDELARRVPPTPLPTALSVTDLVGARPAYWRRVGPPIPVPPDRQEARERGQWYHAAVGRALAADGPIEVRVRQDGVAGRIDVLTDAPTEVKTSAGALTADQLLDARADHVEQIAFYCALLGRSAGRLLYLQVSDASIDSVRAFDVRFDGTERLRVALRARADALRAALREGSPARLPRCRWYRRGCEFQSSGACDCAGSEPEPDDRVLGAVVAVEDAAAVAERVTTALHGAVRPDEPPLLERFRDLLYSRRAYFERTAVRSPDAGDSPKPLPSEAYQELLAVVEGGPAGEMAGLPLRSDEPGEDVVGFRGSPVLLRTSRAWDPIDPEALPDRSPQYALELGFRCVATGADRGRVIVAYERATVPRDRFAVYEVRFRSGTPFSRLWRSRRADLARALTSHDPTGLVACPAWMAEDCPYAADCGCADVARSQR